MVNGSLKRKEYKKGSDVFIGDHSFYRGRQKCVRSNIMGTDSMSGKRRLKRRGIVYLLSDSLPAIKRR